MAVKTFGPNEAINERSDAQYGCTFHEAAVGEPVLNAAAITTIVATLADMATGEILNSRDEQDVRNANGGTLDTDGTFTLQLDDDDNVVVTRHKSREKHRLTLEVTFNRTGGGTGTLNHEVQFYVLNLEHV
jgi:hypothetical protein